MSDGDGGLVTLGETLGLLVADDVGPLSLARGMRLSMGGAESNVAIGASRLGVPATWIGRLGNDPIGDLIERQLLAERVRCLVQRDPSPTAIMLRERRTGTVGAGVLLPPRQCRLAPAPCRHSGRCRREGRRAAPVRDHPRARGRSRRRRSGRRCGGPGRQASWSRSTSTSGRGCGTRARPPRCSGSWRPVRTSSSRATTRPVSRSRSDASVGPEALADALAALGPSEVVVKLGRHGATARIDGELIEVPAVPVHAVDTVGAGDAFVAGLPRVPPPRPRGPGPAVHRRRHRCVRGHRAR